MLSTLEEDSFGLDGAMTINRYIDGHDFMWAISELMLVVSRLALLSSPPIDNSSSSDSAERQICLLDWWCVLLLGHSESISPILMNVNRLSPELYLRRPPGQFQDWRLDRLLLKKATQGIRVHIIVYQEVRTRITRRTQLFHFATVRLVL